mmetsp:Transcript_88094/g.172319  ORF Transcript_88094/g.172319 Transcript_88094/m.172319 type:complete len:228 (+) Transcript_88094:1588-2271(+)
MGGLPRKGARPDRPGIGSQRLAAWRDPGGLEGPRPEERAEHRGQRGPRKRVSLRGVVGALQLARVEDRARPLRQGPCEGRDHDRHDQRLVQRPASHLWADPDDEVAVRHAGGHGFRLVRRSVPDDRWRHRQAQKAHRPGGRTGTVEGATREVQGAGAGHDDHLEFFAAGLQGRRQGQERGQGQGQGGGGEGQRGEAEGGRWPEAHPWQQVQGRELSRSARAACFAFG